MMNLSIWSQKNNFIEIQYPATSVLKANQIFTFPLSVLSTKAAILGKILRHTTYVIKIEPIHIQILRTISNIDFWVPLWFSMSMSGLFSEWYPEPVLRIPPVPFMKDVSFEVVCLICILLSSLTVVLIEVVKEDDSRYCVSDDSKNSSLYWISFWLTSLLLV